MRSSEKKHTSKRITQNEKLDNKVCTLTPRTKRSRNAQLFPEGSTDGSTSKQCAICFEAVDLQSDDYRESHTNCVSANIRIWATSLNKHDITANLIVNYNDLHAADAVYHLDCYTKLKNEYRELMNERSKQSVRQVENAENDKRKEAFDAVCNHIQEMKSSDKTVFLLKDLFSMYVTYLTKMGILLEPIPNGEPGEDVTYMQRVEDNTETFYVSNSKTMPAYRTVNRTRFKSSLLQSFPNLKESVRNNHVYLIFEEDLGETLHSTSLNESVNYESDEAILSRAIEILRGYTTPNDKFNGEFGLDCERKSVDDRVTEFILKWITGSKSVQLDDSPRLRQALTIGQIVDFNSIKYGRKDRVSHGGRIEGMIYAQYLVNILHCA